MSTKVITEPDANVVQIAGGASSVPVRGYRPELDVVRFVAFLLVFIHHFFPPIAIRPEELAASTGRESWRLTLSLAEMCAMGLCLFFTLSGYLITGILLAERANKGVISVRRFYIRRALRIWPLYFFGIGIGIAIALLLNHREDVVGLTWYLLFAGNFYCAAHGWLHNPMNPLWSISIEEQFYLLWPWAMRWFSRRGLLLCALGFIAVANVTLYIFGHRHDDTDIKVWTNTIVQFEMFATGILLALSKPWNARHSFATGLSLALIGPILWFVACYGLHSKQPAEVGTAIGGAALVAGYTLIALGCAAVLQGFCMMGPQAMPRWAATLGKISYGLYVYHLLAIEFAKACVDPARGFWQMIASAAIALILTIAAAVLSYAFLETPFLKLKRRFETVHSRPI
jgi:peptidoglycan/LPS O-acetylase OafA/YrhL